MVAVMNPFRGMVPRSAGSQVRQASAPQQQQQQRAPQQQRQQQGAPQRQQQGTPVAQGRPTQQQLQQRFANQFDPNEGARSQPQYRQDNGLRRDVRAAIGQYRNDGSVNPNNIRDRQAELTYDEQGNFNPRSFGGEQLRAGVRTAMHGAGRTYDNKGEMNAWSKDDAVIQLANMLRDVNAQQKMAQMNVAQSDLPDWERREIIASAMETEEGRRIIGQEMALPIKDMIDYQDSMSKVFRNRPLQQGDFFRVALDIRVPAFVVGQDGEGIEAVVEGLYKQPKEFTITAYGAVGIDDVYEMNYDVLDRIQSTARQELMLQQDIRGIALLDVGGRALNAPFTVAGLSIAAFEQGRVGIERWRLQADKFLINRIDASNVFVTMAPSVDPATARELYLSGWIGNILSCKVFTYSGLEPEEVVPQGTFYTVVAPDYLGELGTRFEIFSEPYNHFANQRLVKGWAFGKRIGYVLVNPRGVQVGTV